MCRIRQTSKWIVILDSITALYVYTCCCNSRIISVIRRPVYVSIVYYVIPKCHHHNDNVCKVMLIAQWTILLLQYGQSVQTFCSSISYRWSPRSRANEKKKNEKSIYVYLFFLLLSNRLPLYSVTYIYNRTLLQLFHKQDYGEAATSFSVHNYLFILYGFCTKRHVSL